MQNLKDWKPGTHRKVFLAGKPKSAGKTTFAMTAPGVKLVLQYDLGNAVLPPGVDPASIYFKQYQAAETNMLTGSDRWQRATNVGDSIIKDVTAVKEGFRKGGPIVIDGVEIPLPDVIIMDGLTEMPLVMTDWILGVNKKTDADEFVENGRPNYFKLWQKRIEVMRPILHSIIPLPAHVVLIGWEVGEIKDNKPTGQIIPDIGGKLDNLIPGKVDAALRCFAKFQDGPHYIVQCQPDGVRDWIGIRGAYNLPKEVDVTITGNSKLNPWQKVFGNN